MECWSCSPNGHGSDYLCARCAARGASKHKLSDQELLQCHRSFKALWTDQEAWAAAEARMMKEMEG